MKSKKISEENKKILFFENKKIICDSIIYKKIIESQHIQICGIQLLKYLE